MDKLIKCLIFDGLAKITAIENTDMVNESIKMHDLTPLATAALGRSLTVGAYLANGIKIKGGKFSMTIDGGGGLGKIVIAGSEGNKVKGYVTNKSFDLPIRDDGKIDVGGGVGIDGEIEVIKDLGLKDNYIGRCNLVSGEIAEDFNHYLLKSEGIPSAVTLGVLLNKDGCISSGGIIIEAMPGINEDQLCMLEDIASNLSNFSNRLAEKQLEELISFHFGHLNAEIFPVEKIYLDCNCSEEKLKAVIRSLGKEEALDIINSEGKIEIFYEFNSKFYNFTKDDIKEIFEI